MKTSLKIIILLVLGLSINFSFAKTKLIKHKDFFFHVPVSKLKGNAHFSLHHFDTGRIRADLNELMHTLDYENIHMGRRRNLFVIKGVFIANKNWKEFDAAFMSSDGFVNSIVKKETILEPLEKEYTWDVSRNKGFSFHYIYKLFFKGDESTNVEDELLAKAIDKIATHDFGYGSVKYTFVTESVDQGRLGVNSNTFGKIYKLDENRSVVVVYSIASYRKNLFLRWIIRGAMVPGLDLLQKAMLKNYE